MAALAFAAIAIAVLAARPVRTPGPLARDFEAYWAAGSTWTAHADPYGRAIWNAERMIPGVDARHDELLPFIGPPATLLAWSVAARLPYESATRAWWAILAVGVLALATAVIRGSGMPITALSVFGALVLAIAFAPISSDLALGQLALPAFVGAVLVVILSERSLITATLAACLAFTQPNAAIGLISQLGRNRATIAVAMGASLAYAVGAIAAGWMWPFAYLRVLAAHGAAERFIAIQFSPAAIAYGFGAPPFAAGAIGIALAASAIGAAIAIAHRVREIFARFCAFAALSPFVAGFFHEHDLVVAYAAAVWCALRTTATARTIALAGTLLAGVDWLGLAQRPTGIVQSGLLAIAAFTAFVALSKDVKPRGIGPVAIAVAVIFTGAAVLATHHPAPVWPATLAAYHAPANAGAAEVWLAEQRASGLLAVVPAWALLRSLSLLGCALLAYAIYRHSAYCRTA
jgi:hypothetical protein